MIDKDIQTSDWLTRGISPTKLRRIDKKVKAHCDRELKRREKKIQRRTRRICKIMRRVGYTYDEIIDLARSYIVSQTPIIIPDDVRRSISTAVQDVPARYTITVLGALQEWIESL